MGGSSKKRTTTTYTPPEWVTQASQDAIGMGQRISRQQYRPYEGQRIAEMSGNEVRGYALAQENIGKYQPYYNKAMATSEKGQQYLERGTQQFKDANIQDYMNPYIKGALDPAAREIREAGARDAMALNARASSMDAFGGSRAALMRSENEANTYQQISDLYGRGYAQAYESAVNVWGGERARDLEAAGRFQMMSDQYRQMGEGAYQMGAQDVSTLLTTGAMERSIRQAGMDFDYQQWKEGRDWDLRGLSALLASIQGTKGSYEHTTTSKTKVKKDNTAEYVGAAVQLIGMAMMFSDERLKENIRFVKTINGLDFYTWTWNAIARSLGFGGFPTVGVIAQEIDQDFVMEHESGYLMVDYGRLLGGV